MKKILSIMAIFALTACANSPSSIAPASVSSHEYDHLTCEQLSAELAIAQANLSEASSKQNGAQAADALTVFLVLIPASSLVGDHEADVAKYKGEQQALKRAIARRCGLYAEQKPTNNKKADASK